MKHLKLVPLVFFISVLLTSCESVISYNDTIITPMINISENVERFDTAKTEEDFENIANDLVGFAEEGLKSSEGLEDYNGNTSFRDAAIKYYEKNKAIFGREDIAHNLMMGFSDDSFSDEDFNSQEFSSFNDQLEELVELEDRLVIEQEQFAKANNMTLDNRGL